MSHVSQHFNEREMKKVSQNIYQRLKEDGIFVFDALIPEKNQKWTKIFTNDDIKKGQYGFDKNFLMEMFEKVGFKLLEIADYNESAAAKAFYIDSPGWGGKGVIDAKNLIQKPISLKWLTLKK